MASATSPDFWKIPRESLQIREEIGRGGWGVVAKGIFRGQEVAVKWPHKAILNRRNIERLKREVEILAKVRHPNLLLFIAAVFDRKVEQLEESPLIITELLGIDLRMAYERGKLEYSSKFTIFKDIACALNYLHQHHDPIIHRDVSAPNVLLEALSDNKWRAKLSDFGSANLAKVAQTVGEGAIIYTAPETFPVRDPKAVVPPQTTKIDVFSFGVLLCEVITDQLPDQEHYLGMLQQVERKWPRMYNIILLCTKTEPRQRPTMEEVLKELRGIPQPSSTWKDPAIEIAQLKQEKQQQQAQLQQAERTRLGLRQQLQLAERTQLDLRQQLQQTEDTEQTLRQQLQESARREQALTQRLQQAQHAELSLRRDLQLERARAQHEEKQLRKQLHDQLQLATSSVPASVPTNLLRATPGSHHSGVKGQKDAKLPHTQMGIWSTVQLGDPPQYGVIRWIGELPGVQKTMAGIEFEQDVKGGSNGAWSQTGERYFECVGRRGKFVPLQSLVPDERFVDPTPSPTVRNPLDDVQYEVKEPVHVATHPYQIRKYIGDRRGIQGHQNSSFIDAVLFGLFALTEHFDDVLKKWVHSRQGREIQTMLKERIVNPLRRNGVVRSESVKALRIKVDQVKGMDHTEDPKLFLEGLFSCALDVKPFIAIRLTTEVQSEFFVQLLVGPSSQRMETVESLLIYTFTLQGYYLTCPSTVTSFQELPSKLLIQLNRPQVWNKYQMVLPSTTLNATRVIDPRSVYYDDEAGSSIRRYSNMELVSVICSEDGHYVCFSQSNGQWMFFNSMASTTDDGYNIPVGVDCTRELNEWVFCRDHQRLQNTPPWKIPGCVRRFTEDVYICIYTV